MLFDVLEEVRGYNFDWIDKHINFLRSMLTNNCIDLFFSFLYGFSVTTLLGRTVLKIKRLIRFSW